MPTTNNRRLGFLLAVALVLSGIAVLNMGPAPAAAGNCPSDGGSGGTPTGSGSPSASSSTGGGGITLPPIPTLLPGSSSSTASSSTASTSTPSGGQSYSCRSSISIEVGGGKRFHGKVKSPYSTCIKGRIITLFRKKAGADAQVGHDLSTRKGAWKITDGDASGKYYASAHKDTFATEDGHVTCAAATSRTVKV